MTRSLATHAFALAATNAWPQPFDVSWWTADGGGGASAGGGFAVQGTAGQADAGGPFAGGPHVLHSGFWATAVGGTTPALADIAVSKSDSRDPVPAGGILVYTIGVANLGPAPAPAVTVTDPLPRGVAFVSAVPGCSHAGGLVSCALGALAPGASTTVTVTVAVGEDVRGVLTNVASATGGAPDPVAATDADAEDTTVVVQARAELAHGMLLRADLASFAGLPDVDLHRVRQEPYASYEVVLDEASGDLGLGAGPSLDRVAADGSTVLQPSVPGGTGPARSLRFRNATDAPVDDQMVRVRSAGCLSDCGADDRYRLRAWETTARVARFNNAGSQLTVLLLQNTTSGTVAGTVYAWTPNGTLAGQRDFTLEPRGLLVLGTGELAPGGSGSLTVAHDGPYGSLAGKAVALEPSTGFSFDSPLLSRPR